MHSPSRAYLAPGMKFSRGPAKYHVRAFEGFTHMTCELQPGQFVTLETAQFEKEYLDGHIVGLQSEHRPIKLQNHPDAVLDACWERAKPHQHDKARRRYTYIKHVESEGPVIFDRGGILEEQLATAAEALGEKPPGRTTFYEWYRDYKIYGGTIEGCLRHRHLHGSARKSRLDEDAKRLLDEELAVFVAGGFRRTAEEWTSEVNKRIERHNDRVLPAKKVPPIHASTWKRHVKQMPMMAQLIDKFGRHSAKKKLMRVDRVAEPDFPLQVVQMDHTRLQINCRDEATGKLYGEIWCTAMLCRKTRMILGYVLHIARHDAEVVARCFAMMALPKADFKNWCPEAVNAWPCYGLPNLLLGDNGKEFISEVFRSLTARLGVSLAIAPSYTPEWKGSVERYFGTMKGNLIKRLRGATPRAGADKVPKPKDKDVTAFTLAELDAIVGRWVVDFYHQEKHDGLGMPPIKAWEELIPNVYRNIPASVDDLMCRAGRAQSRKLRREGVLVDTDYYWSEDLGTLYEQLGPDADPVKVMVSHRSAYTVYVVDPVHDKYIRARNKNEQCRQEYTREKWEQIKRTGAQRNLDVGTIVGAGRAASLVEEANAKLVKAARASKRAAARQARADGRDLDLRKPPEQAKDAGSEKLAGEGPPQATKRDTNGSRGFQIPTLPTNPF